MYAGISVGYKDLGVQLLAQSVAVNSVYLKLLGFPNTVASLEPHRSSIWEFRSLHVFANMGTIYFSHSVGYATYSILALICISMVTDDVRKNQTSPVQKYLLKHKDNFYLSGINYMAP